MKKCWILCTPRTGSSYLCDLMNNSDLFCNYNHSKLVDTVGPIQKGMAFNEWLRIFGQKEDFLKNPPFTLKAIFHQYIEVFAGIPFIKRYKPGIYAEEYDKNLCDSISTNFDINYIKNILPQINFIHLKRKNKIDHTLSLYFARVTKKYHIYDSNALSKYLSCQVEFKEDLLKKTYLDAKSYDSLWNNFINKEQIKEVYYEDLVDKTSETLSDIFDYLKLNNYNVNDIINKTKAQNRLLKMTRTNDLDYFKKKLASIISNKFI